MRSTVFHTLSQVPRGSWNLLAKRAGLYSSYEWLCSVEQETQGACRYLLVNADDGRPAGALPLYFTQRETNWYYDARFHFAELPPNGAGGTSCVAGNRRGYRNEPLLAEWLTDRQQDEVLRALLDGVRETAWEHGSDFAAFLYLSGHAKSLFDIAVSGSCGTVPRPVLGYGGDAWIDIHGISMADHLAAVSPKRRGLIRREMRHFSKHGLRITVEDPRKYVEKILYLVGQLAEKYGTENPDDEVRSLLERPEPALGAAARLFACWDGDTMVGMALGYEWGDRLYMRIAGFDYDRLPGAFEYFNTVIYEPLQHCYRAGLRGLHLGSGSHQAKALRGARIEPLVSLVLPLGKLLSTDPVNASARRTARRYWEGQFAAIPNAFDQGRWTRLLDLCSLPGE
ncbi:GNAT family N-acetyltransferase [Streptomyces sp. NPDC088348]|uniref:GNAT family N-acetyltransferase n=1 Tax=Streptomyces sp. NPDC088348 TaxID=3365853 RepID=UPI00382E2C2B